MKLNLGCGRDYKEGWINVDIGKKDIQGRDILIDKGMDLNKLPYDFPNNSAEVILLDNVLEHLDNQTEVMKELYRILENKGELIVIVPHYTSWSAYTDPTHRNYYSLQMGNRNNFKNKFILKEMNLNISHNKVLKLLNPIINIFPYFYERICFGIFNPQEIIFKYTKNEQIKKEQNKQWQ